MGTIIDRARAAARAEVCSLYLMDRDGTGVTLAATNGLDREQIGVARLPLGVGITGLAADAQAHDQPQCPPRPALSLGPRRRRSRSFTSMCSVPLIWNDAGRRRAQRPDRASGAFLASATCASSRRSPGCWPACRAQPPAAEAEAQLESLRAIDEARANLVAVVTHALRTPLAVVRAYVELLGGARPGRPEQPDAADWEQQALEQVDRLDQTVDSILASLRVFPNSPDGARAPSISRPWPRRGARRGADAPPPHACDHLRDATAAGHRLGRDRSGGCWATCSRTHRSTRRSAGTIDIYGWQLGRARLPGRSRTTGRASPRSGARRIFEPFVRLDDSPRGAGIGLFAARHLARAMGGDLRVEARVPRGSQFVLEFPPPASPLVGSIARNLRPFHHSTTPTTQPTTKTTETTVRACVCPLPRGVAETVQGYRALRGASTSDGRLAAARPQPHHSLAEPRPTRQAMRNVSVAVMKRIDADGSAAAGVLAGHQGRKWR